MKPLLYLSLFFLIALGHTSQAQFISAKLDLAGLKCSLCSNSVEKSIRQLDFVKDMKVDLNDNTSEVVFKPGKKVNINALAQKVYDAGFSVIHLSAVFDFNNQILDNETSFTFADDQYVLVKGEKKALNSKVKLTFVGENFLSRKEYKNWEELLPKQVERGKAANIYFVAL